MVPTLSLSNRVTTDTILIVHLCIVYFSSELDVLETTAALFADRLRDPLGGLVVRRAIEWDANKLDLVL